MPSTSRAGTCVVLAGGAGSRLGGDKHLRELAGRPLGAYPLAAAESAGLEPALVAKPGTPLEPLVTLYPGARVVREADDQRHPLLGVLAALEAIREPIVVCPCDTPHVTPKLLAELAAAPATVAAADRGPEPLIGRWEPAATEALRAAIAAGTSARALVANLGVASLGVDPETIANVNTEADLDFSADRIRRLRS